MRNDLSKMVRNAETTRPTSAKARPPMKVRELMRDGPVLELDHEGEIYRLRITRNQKLILTK